MKNRSGKTGIIKQLEQFSRPQGIYKHVVLKTFAACQDVEAGEKVEAVAFRPV